MTSHDYRSHLRMIRRKCIDNVFANYKRQLWKDKKMTIILNNYKSNLKRYRKTGETL